jgi:nitroreductase
MPSFPEVKAGLAMPLAEAMATQRTIRRLLPDPVDDETVRRLLELAVRAPSGGDLQNWEFVVVRDPDVKHQLARLNRQSWSVFKRMYALRGRRDERVRKGLAASQWLADHYEETPVVVVACLRGPRPWFPPFLTASYYGSIFPAVQNLLLAARAMGLGASLSTLSVWSTVLARRTLGLPWKVNPIAAVPLGWPRGSYGPTTRRPVEDLAHLDRYGNRAFPA